MHYAVVGRIMAEMPDGCSAFGVPGFLRLYNGGLQPAVGMPVGSLPIAVDLEREFADFGEHYLAREPLDPEGGYEIGIDDRQHPYTGGTLRAVLELPFVKPATGAARHVTKFLLLGAFTPDWKGGGKTASVTWNHQIGAQTWCNALECHQLECLATS